MIPRRLGEWARRLELPHRSSPRAEGPLRCAWLHHGPGPHQTPENKSVGAIAPRNSCVPLAAVLPPDTLLFRDITGGRRGEDERP